MNYESLYVGTIRTCINKELYDRYGEIYYEGSYDKKMIEFNKIRHNVKTIDTSAIVVKTYDGKYVLLRDINKSYKTRLLAELGLFPREIKTFPEEDGDIFVEEESLIKYETEEENMSLKRINRQLLFDSRIKGGIEN